MQNEIELVSHISLKGHACFEKTKVLFVLKGEIDLNPPKKIEKQN